MSWGYRVCVTEDGSGRPCYSVRELHYRGDLDEDAAPSVDAVQGWTLVPLLDASGEDLAELVDEIRSELRSIERAITEPVIDLREGERRRKRIEGYTP
jgi:hypothetical protein